MTAYKYAQLLLKYRPRSEHEIRERLLRRGYEKKEISEVIKKLKDLNLIDDWSFSRFWINYRLCNSPKSKFFIKRELEIKGVSQELITQALRERKDFDEKLLAYELAQKKYRSLKNISDPLVKKRRIYSYLQRRGFSYEMIREVVQNILGEN